MWQATSLWQKVSPALAACLVPLSVMACDGADDTGPGGAGGGGGAGAAGAGGSAGAGAGGSGGTGGAAERTRVAFGSCLRETKDKPVLDLATASAPDLFVFLGDNIYGDTVDMAVLQSKYDKLAASPEYQGLLAATPVIATWDDHDYGQNDAGKEYPMKAESKAIFLDFWKEPADSPRRVHEGIYTSYTYAEPGGTLQVILLDTRWFRDPLDLNSDPAKYKNQYQPTTDTTRTILGEEQWAWLEGELMKPADVRLIGTSIQLGHEYNGWESWTNMPHEQQRMIDLIESTGAEGVVFLSGDVHWGELSRLESAGVYPLYDLTSSGITETWPIIESNVNRVGMPVPENNYGFVDITWGASAKEHKLTLGLVDVTGAVRVTQDLTTAELSF